MTLTDVQDGDSVFLDANIFIYHFGGRSVQCKTLLYHSTHSELLFTSHARERSACFGCMMPVEPHAEIVR